MCPSALPSVGGYFRDAGSWGCGGKGVVLISEYLTLVLLKFFFDSITPQANPCHNILFLFSDKLIELSLKSPCFYVFTVFHPPIPSFSGICEVRKFYKI
jgi:hypothetical protein